MRIGVPKEIKNHEYRVGLTPASVKELTGRGHQVSIETQAGAGIGFEDDDYRAEGADILPTASEVFEQAELIVKVKEPQAEERRLLKPEQAIFTYLHLAPDVVQTRELMDSGALCIAYETVTDLAGHLPLLTPMSEVAGRMAIQAGAHCLEKAQGGCGVLLGGVPGVSAAKVTVIGAGVAGRNAVAMAVGMGGEVSVLDRNIAALRVLDERFGNRICTLRSTAHHLEKAVLEADLVVGAVLIPGATAPKLVTREQVSRMRKGSVLVDISIDQGGCFETSRPTTHQDPTFEVDGVVHYCVANMPGAVARTSTLALNNATLSFVIALADKGIRQALLDDPHLLNGLNVARGHICRPEVAEAQGLVHVDAREALADL